MYNSVNVKLSDETEVNFQLSLNMTGTSENNFLHTCLLTDRQVSRFRKTFSNHPSGDIYC